LPTGTQIRVTNLVNGRSIIVVIADRGPFSKKRIIDLSYAAAKHLGFVNQGTAKVRVTFHRAARS
jgi:rare lipoprotein A